MKIVDLTLELHDGLQTFPGHPSVEIKAKSTFENSKHRYIAPCEGFESRFISFSDHTGTHVDAPLHFIANGESSEQMDMKRLIGSAIMLDVTPDKQDLEPVTREMLEKAERRQGLYVENGDIVLVRTWKKEWGIEGFFEAHAFSPCAGEWLVRKKIDVIGLDLPNIDVNGNMRREVHMQLLGENIYVVENLVNLSSLPKNDRFTFFGVPLKLKNATASPIRAYAMLNAQII